MANYFYKWTPLFVLGTILLLGLPWLGLIALIVVVFVLVSTLAALAFAAARAIGAVSRAISHRWHGGRIASEGVTRALSPTGSPAFPKELS